MLEIQKPGKSEMEKIGNSETWNSKIWKPGKSESWKVGNLESLKCRWSEMQKV